MILLLETILWKTENNGIISHTYEEFKIIFRELGENKKQLIAKYWNLKYQILNAITIEEINNINWVYENE